ncbi:MAG: arylsulfatase [Phycisphaerae bacterium]
MNLSRILLAVLAIGAVGVSAADARRPNVIFILADDLGYGDVGCYGQKKIKTPHIDRLAAEGMRFTQFYSGSPVCASSRCALLTGRHMGHAYIRDNRATPPEGQWPLREGETTVADVLKGAGYRTACVGKWGLGGPGSVGEPGRHGFDHFFGYLCQSIAHTFYPEYLWRNTDKVMLPENVGGARGAPYSHDLMTREAVELINKWSADEKPFFLYLAYTVPHFDLDVPEDSMTPYKALGWNDPPDPSKGGGYRPQPTPRAAYAGMISRMDRDIGTLMALLKEKRIDEQTLVVFSSDNGPTHLPALDVKFFESAGPLRGLKGSVYEGGIRVPFIARWPGRIAAGKVSEQVGAFWDVLPTLSELSGAEPGRPVGTDGVSLVPTLLGRGEQKQPEYLYWEQGGYGGNQAVRLGDWKGVRTGLRKNENAPVQLYDLKSDVGESRDVAKENPDVVKRFEQILKDGRTDSPDFPLFAPRKPGN